MVRPVEWDIGYKRTSFDVWSVFVHITKRKCVSNAFENHKIHRDATFKFWNYEQRLEKQNTTTMKFNVK